MTAAMTQKTTTAIDQANTILDLRRCDKAECGCVASSEDGKGMTHCPVHDDEHPSLSVWIDPKGKAAVNCTSQHCDNGSIWRALKLCPGEPNLREVCAYDYRDEHGVLLYQSVRYEPKAFRPWRVEGKKWRPGIKGIRRVPYRLPELLAAPADAVVFIPEGEKDVDRLYQEGLVATTNQGGAGAWLGYDYAAWLKGRIVVVIPDRDTAGIKHAIAICRDLIGVAQSVRVLDLP